MGAHKILLVDDNETSLKLLKAIFESEYDVASASDGLEALEVLFQHKVDLVISDILMPNMDGYHLCYKIRTNDKLKNIPIIIYTATYTSHSEEKVARDMGANMYLRKPAPIKVLSSVVRETLAEPQKYPHKTPDKSQSIQLMRQYSEKLINKLEQSNVELEEIKNRLESSEKQFREFFENSPVALIVFEVSSNKFVNFNGNAIRLLKFSNNELLKKGPAEISPVFQPDGQSSEDKAKDMTVKAMNGEKPVFEWIVLNSDGKEIICEVRLVSLSSVGVPTILASFVDITERKNAENEIKELNEHLEERVQERTAELTEVNKALEAFSYSVSHDLKSPARVITSITKIILQNYINKMDTEEKNLFKHIEDSGKRMSAIIDDLLTLAKYGKKKLKLEQVNMAWLVQGIWLNISRNTTHSAALELAELPVVRVDMSMMQQVLVNLLSNAIKYSSKKEKPVVKIWCEQKEESVTFYFKDNGAGFDMRNYDRLFGAFQRLHSTSEFEGTGVGLMLVKRIIEMHGGTIGAEAKVGEGATFYFAIPIA